MAGLMQEVKTGGLLSNYPRMYSVLRDTAKALTVDQGLSLSDMVSLAENLRTLTSKSVRFITVPNGQDPSNPNRVVWTQPAADHLFNAIEHDTSIPKTKEEGGIAVHHAEHGQPEQGPGRGAQRQRRPGRGPPGGR